jgi:hypothetical protein
VTDPERPEFLRVCPRCSSRLRTPEETGVRFGSSDGADLDAMKRQLHVTCIAGHQFVWVEGETRLRSVQG